MKVRSSTTPAKQVNALLRDYADRGVFRSFSASFRKDGGASFRFIWHRDREFELSFDAAKKVLIIPEVLPAVDPKSELYANFKLFVESLHSKSRVEHRRIEPLKARVRCANRKGVVALTVTVKDDDYSYAVERLMQMVQETYLIFLSVGIYYNYRVEALGADPDWG